MAGQQVTVLKDDGWNTNVMSRTFLENNRHLLNIKKTALNINNSNNRSVELSSEMMFDNEIEIENHN